MKLIKVGPMEHVPGSEEQSRPVLTSENSFAWSLKPLFISLKLIIIDVGHYNECYLQFSSTLKSKLLTYTAYIWFVVSLIIHLITIIFLLTHESPHPTSTFLVNCIVDHINFNVRNVAVHFGLLFIVRRRWEKLWKYVNELEMLIGNQPKVYRNLRIMSTLGIAYGLIMVL